jgi:hypothetical protein
MVFLRVTLIMCVDIAYSLFLIVHNICALYMTKHIVMNGHQKDIRYDEIELCAQSINVISNQIVYKIGRTSTSLKERETCREEKKLGGRGQNIEGVSIGK